jgi:hypothetical protein
LGSRNEVQHPRLQGTPLVPLMRRRRLHAGVRLCPWLRAVCVPRPVAALVAPLAPQALYSALHCCVKLFRAYIARFSQAARARLLAHPVSHSATMSSAGAPEGEPMTEQAVIKRYTDLQNQERQIVMKLAELQAQESEYRYV